MTSSGEVEITKTGERTYTFQMPGENVTVNAIIRRLEYYSVVFKNWDGQWLSWNDYPEGSTVAYTGQTPVREPGETTAYTFDH